MKPTLNPELDLTLSRIIQAPRAVVWRAWTEPTSLEQWWLPAPARCKVVELDLVPGGAFVTRMSENGGDFMPHLSASFLAVDNLERIVFTTSLVAGWRPAEQPFISMTAIITLGEHPQGTEYSVHVMHKNPADQKMHLQMGFHDGWGAVTQQLATLAERRA